MKSTCARLQSATRVLNGSRNAVDANAFITRAVQPAPEAPSSSGPLSGLSVAVKDMFCTKDMPTTCASRMLQDFTPPYDATVVSLLRNSGAHICGKTNMDEFGMGSANVHSHYGPTLNPSNPSSDSLRVAGGSSGGSAAAVASGECDLALASDTGGSTRLPAAYCGIYGLKPSYGLLSRFGMVAYASSLDCVGLMSRDLGHLRSLFDTLNEYDEKDPTAIPEQHRPRLQVQRHLQGDLSGIKIGVPIEFLPEELDEAILVNFRQSVKLLKSLGATVVPVSLPATPHALSTYYVLSSSEASSNLARYSGMFYGHRDDPQQKESLPALSRSQGFGTEVQKRILLGNFALNADAFENYFLAAQHLRSSVRADFDAVFRQISPLADPATKLGTSPVIAGGVDCLVHPAAISAAPRLDANATTADSQISDEYAQDLLNVPSSLAGIPAISVPFGTDQDGWPLAVQLAAQWGQESLLFDVALNLSKQ